MIITLLFVEKVSKVQEGTFLYYTVEGNPSIEDLKRSICDKYTELKPNQLELYYKDTPLENSTPLLTLGIKSDEKLFIGKNERRTPMKIIFKFLYLLVFCYFLYLKGKDLYNKYWDTSEKIYANP